jgi:hypothetical protein
MRLWSIHPKYLDSYGLVAVWREGLLALEVLKGNTKGYKNHPQLIRFKNTKDPVNTIKNFLGHIYQEAANRDYHFNPGKIQKIEKVELINVTSGQLEYEITHLKNKLLKRNVAKLQEIEHIKKILPHPLFNVIKGKIEQWEIVK